MGAPVNPAEVVGVELFANLSDQAAAQAVRSMRRVKLAPEQILFLQGEEGHTVYVLVTGSLDVYAETEGERHPLATLQAGSILGHLGLLVDAPRSATVVACTAAELWEIDRVVLLAALEAGEVWAARFLLAAARQLAALLGSVSKQVVELAERANANRHDAPAARVMELDELRRRLSSEWTF